MPALASLNAQIREVQREIKMRETVYPKWIKQNRLTQAEADHRLRAMRAVFETLAGVQWMIDRCDTMTPAPAPRPAAHGGARPVATPGPRTPPRGGSGVPVKEQQP